MGAILSVGSWQLRSQRQVKSEVRILRQTQKHPFIYIRQHKCENLTGQEATGTLRTTNPILGILSRRPRHNVSTDYYRTYNTPRCNIQIPLRITSHSPTNPLHSDARIEADYKLSASRGNQRRCRQWSDGYGR